MFAILSDDRSLIAEINEFAFFVKTKLKQGRIVSRSRLGLDFYFLSSSQGLFGKMKGHAASQVEQGYFGDSNS
jgi:hypothetical protein